jgi:hypothetical protein
MIAPFYEPWPTQLTDSALSTLAGVTAGHRDDLDEVCKNASEAARSRGHELSSWSAPPGEEAVARRAACRRCGRVGYVRAESGFVGAAGPALREPCVEEQSSG